MNIRLRLTLWYTAILLLILAIFSIIVYIGLSRSLMATLDNHLQLESSQIIDGIRFEGTDDEDDDEHDYDEREYGTGISGVRVKLKYVPEKGVFWRVLAANGQPVFDPGYFDGALFGPAVLEANEVRFDYATLADDTPIRLYTVPIIIEQQDIGRIQVAQSYQHIQNIQQQLIFLLAVSIPIILLAASGGGWFLATRALTPIDRITLAASQISANDLNQRLDFKLPNDEVGRLAATFDKMLVRLENAFEQQKRFIADASHELRTPLTILKGDVEVTLNRSRSAEQYRQTLEMVNQTADHLTSLVEELFLLARADNHQLPFQAEQVDLSALLTKQISHLQAQAHRKNITLNLNTPDTLPIIADPVKLPRLFVNLIENAIKHTNSGDTVNVSATTQNGQACISIADTGPGIPPEHLPHLFDRFYRVDKARSHQIPPTTGSGAGLGLSIAQWLAQIHGGHIEVTSKVGQGSTFTVWLPLETSRQ